MKASELRVGNWVNCMRYGDDGYFTIVENIGSYGIDVELGYDGLDPVLDYTASFELLKPIPLTEEWLQDLGFTCVKTSCGMEWLTQDFLLKEGNYFIWAEGSVEIKYVHQLQNLYFALTNTELTVSKK